MGTALLQMRAKALSTHGLMASYFPGEQSDSSTSHADGCHPISCIAQQS